MPCTRQVLPEGGLKQGFQKREGLVARVHGGGSYEITIGASAMTTECKRVYEHDR